MDDTPKLELRLQQINSSVFKEPAIQSTAEKKTLYFCLIEN